MHEQIPINWESPEENKTGKMPEKKKSKKEMSEEEKLAEIRARFKKSGKSDIEYHDHFKD